MYQFLSIVPVGALKTRHAALEHAARQELPGLALDELREARPVAGLRRRAQEGFQVLGDDLMEHGVLGVAGPVDRSLEGHGPQVVHGQQLVLPARRLADDGLEAWAQVLDRAYEWLVGRDAASRYREGRTLSWLKVKHWAYVVEERGWDPGNKSWSTRSPR